MALLLVPDRPKEVEAVLGMVVLDNSIKRTVGGTRTKSAFVRLWLYNIHVNEYTVLPNSTKQEKDIAA